MEAITISQTELDVRPLSPTIGAEIHGVDCAAALDDNTVAAIRRVWLERLVVFFPDQHLDDETQIDVRTALWRADREPPRRAAGARAQGGPFH